MSETGGPSDFFEADVDPQALGRARHVSRASVEYFLRTATSMLRVFPNELGQAVIWMAILDANTRHIMDEPHPPSDFTQFHEMAPDHRRRPVSRSAIANLLGIPFETCRRQINKLLENGFCTEVKGGLIVTAAQLADPRLVQLGRENLVNMRQLMRRLAVDPDL